VRSANMFVLDTITRTRGCPADRDAITQNYSNISPPYE
jgi:hypothetical protein